MDLQRLDELVRHYADAYFQHNPVMASILGLHTYDGELGDFSASNLENRARLLNDLRRDVAAATKNGETGVETLPLDRQIDAELLANRIDLDLLELEKVRIHSILPSFYPDNCLYGVFILTARDFAPMGERVPHILSRLGQIPAFLETAKRNLERPPEIYTRVAMEVAGGGAEFMDETAARVAAAAPGDAGAVAEAATAAKSAFRNYIDYLKNDLLPVSTGDFALGEDVFNERLKYEHMISKSAQEIGEFGKRLFEGTKREMADLASRIRSGAHWREIITDAKKLHPEANEIKVAYEKEMDRARRFVEDKDLVTIPPGETLTIVDTPIFERSIIPYAAYLPPGPFEDKQEGLFYVTPVDPNAPPRAARGAASGAQLLITCHNGSSRGLPRTSSSVGKVQQEYVRHQEANG